MRKNLVIYHRVDYDGIFSGLIVKKYYEEKGIITRTYGWNYGDLELDLSSIINNYQNIIMVDISFSPDVMLKLRETGKLTWIDHHQTAISDSEEHNYSDIPGYRKDGIAACELTWSYFYPNKETPQIIQFVGAYDIWDKTRFDWSNDVVPLQYGLRNEYGVNLNNIEKDWETLSTDCSWVLNTGSTIFEWLKKSSEIWIKNNGFPVTVAGKFKGIALLSPLASSILFESVISEYDIFLIVQINNNGTTYSVSMYSEPDKDLGDFSCGEYLKTYYNGGGHAKAAGAKNLTKEQFERLIFEHEI